MLKGFTMDDERLKELGGGNYWKELLAWIRDYIPATIISEKHRQHWSKDTYVIPEYTFGFECKEDIKLSYEHTECVWLTYDDATKKLKWDSNRTALYELNCRLEVK